jgi:hypothetical protein
MVQGGNIRCIPLSGVVFLKTFVGIIEHGTLKSRLCIVKQIIEKQQCDLVSVIWCLNFQSLPLFPDQTTDFPGGNQPRHTRDNHKDNKRKAHHSDVGRCQTTDCLLGFGCHSSTILHDCILLVNSQHIP